MNVGGEKTESGRTVENGLVVGLSRWSEKSVKR